MPRAKEILPLFLLGTRANSFARPVLVHGHRRLSLGVQRLGCEADSLLI